MSGIPQAGRWTTVLFSGPSVRTSSMIGACLYAAGKGKIYYTVLVIHDDVPVTFQRQAGSNTVHSHSNPCLLS